MGAQVNNQPLNYATSKTIGRVSEIAVLSPLKRGCVPGERRTFEERARATIADVQGRHAAGLPTQLDRIASIHFGRILVLRPEQFLLYSDIPGVTYYPITDYDAVTQAGGPGGKVPDQIDDYQTLPVSPPSVPPAASARSMLLTMVEFDGDLKVYFRDIATDLNADFDLIFENCENYPGTDSFELFWLWIRRYQVNCDLFYPTYPELSVARIKQLEDFKSRFDAFVASVRTPLGSRVGSMDELFDDFLRESQQYAANFPSPGGIYTPGGASGD
jgi:hypothetical protein